MAVAKKRGRPRKTPVVEEVAVPDEDTSLFSGTATVTPQEKTEEKVATRFVFPATGVLSGAGHHITHIEGQETFIPPQLHAAALGKGAKPVDGVSYTPPPKEKPERRDTSPVAMEKAVRAAMWDVIARNNYLEFSGNGRPKLSIIRKAVGVDIPSTMLDEVWWSIRKELYSPTPDRSDATT